MPTYNFFVHLAGRGSRKRDNDDYIEEDEREINRRERDER